MPLLSKVFRAEVRAMREKIVKIGKTCYVRLSKDYRDQYNLLEKSYIEVREQPDGSIVIIPEGVQ